MHDTIRSIREAGERLRAEHATSDEIGRLSDSAAAIVRESGGIRLMQSKRFGGEEADPRVFFDWVREVGRHNPSAGWIAGVVGVHPWEFALHDEQLQEELYGADPDTWIASPYAPQGQAVPTDGGFILRGRWSYSTGTDHCGWVVLGGIVVDETGSPGEIPDVRHFVLPRGDYEIVEGSWNVMGLQGTGSKDIAIEGSFVPEHRTLSHTGLTEGMYGDRRADATIYQLPFACIFSAAIASATFGIAQCLVDHYRTYLETRMSMLGNVGKTDPFQQEALAEMEADLAAGIAHLDVMVGDWLDRAARGEAFTTGDRLEFRRNQVRAVQRVLFAADKLMSRAGSAAVWSTRPLERAWRDLRTAGTHISNVMDAAYIAWANDEFETGVRTHTFH